MFNGVFAQPKTIFVQECPKGEDATQLVTEALRECKSQKASKIVFTKGKYEFRPDFASEKYVFISNNDHGLKNNLFDLSDMENLEIDGQGSEFLFHGYLCPFLLDKSKNIKISNLSINYQRTFHSEGTIVGAYKDSLDISFSDAFPFKVRNFRLMFYDENSTSYPFHHLLEFDSAKKEIAYMALDYIDGVENMIAKEIRPGVVRIYLKYLNGTEGNTLIFNAKDRLVPAFTISKSQNIEIRNVTIFHSGGMGVVAQCSRDILLDGLKVIAAPGRMVSLTADATHFVNCRGKITIQNCTLENQMDDAGNIHGIYLKIEKVLSSSQLILRLVHFQQSGLEILSPDTRVEFVTPKDLATYALNSVKTVTRINREYLKVTFKEPVPEKMKVGDIIGSMDDAPDVLIKNCIIQKNRARGFLLGSRGKIVVENNYFHTWWGAIDLYANGVDWFEQGGVRDLTIRNNTFDNCNFGLNVGLGVIVVLANIEENPSNKTYYDRNILIENNTFRIYNPVILSMHSIDGLTFRNNKIEYTNDYRLTPWYSTQKLEPFIMRNSKNIRIEL
jgi:hypothetical protein